MAENIISLQLPGAVEVLTATPHDPRKRVNILTDITNSPTYYIGFDNIYVINEDTHYSITGGSAVDGWVFTQSGGGGGGSDILLYSVENNSGATITKGSVVYPNPTTIIGLADCTIKSKSRAVAVATDDIPNNTIGTVTKAGAVSGLNTLGFTQGQIVYLGSGINVGKFISDKPSNDGYVIIVGVITVVDDTVGVLTVDTNVSDLAVEVTDTNGFPTDQRENTIISVGEEYISITPIQGNEFHFYELGDKYEKTGTQNAPFWDAEGEWWFYFELGVFKSKNNPSSAEKIHIILNHALVCYLYWAATTDGDSGYVVGDIADERHGISMSPQTHAYLHLTRGAQWISGFGLSDFNIGDGDININAQFRIGAGTFFDEDLTHNLLADLDVGTTMPIIYNSGVDAWQRETSQTGFAVRTFDGTPNTRLAYNENDGGIWKLSEVNNNDFVLYHLFTFNGQSTKVISVMGQNQYTTRSNARAGANIEISNLISSLPFPEIVPLSTIIFQTSNRYDNDVQARIVNTDTNENYVDWRTTELAQGAVPSSHANLTNVEQAGLGINDGHINDLAQTIAGEKTFTTAISQSTQATEPTHLMRKGEMETAISTSVGDYLPLAGGTMNGTIYSSGNPIVGTTAYSATDITSKFNIYASGNVEYGMALSNFDGEYSTLIYGPNQAARRISFGKVNHTATPTLHSHITEGAYFDLDDWSLNLTSSISVNEVFESSMSIATLATNGTNGTVYLKPNGNTSTDNVSSFTSTLSTIGTSMKIKGYTQTRDYIEVLDTTDAEGFKVQWNDTDKSIDFIIN